MTQYYNYYAYNDQTEHEPVELSSLAPTAEQYYLNYPLTTTNYGDQKYDQNDDSAAKFRVRRDTNEDGEYEDTNPIIIAGAIILIFCILKI